MAAEFDNTMTPIRVLSDRCARRAPIEVAGWIGLLFE
jgi:hypothetical protein